MSDAPPPLPRTIDDRYEVRGVLGEGGTGIVYDAIAPDGGDVAVKVMHAALAGDEQVRGRFKREAAILARLKGKHVCPILESGETDEGLLFLVLPRIDGPSLASVIAAERLPVDRALEIMAQVATGLSAAHAEGIIHRDLKPANVLLEGGGNVVVVDFGLSKIITGGTGTTYLTKHNMLFGTPEYMSPEQARGDELDARTDVYAAGAMLYELLTGKPPFTGDTPLVVLTSVLTSDVVPPADVPPAVAAVATHALARDRDRRYPTAAALRIALLRARENPDDAARVDPDALAAEDATLPSSGPTPAPLSPASKDPVLDVHATTLAAKSTPSPSRRPPPPSRRPPAQPQPVVDESMRLWIVLWIVVGAASIALGVWLALRS